MGKTLKYVKEFDFGPQKTYVQGYSRGGKACYAEGGKADIAQDKAMVKAAVHKHEKGMHPGKPLTKLAKGGMPEVRAMAKRESVSTPMMEKRAAMQRESIKAPAAPLAAIRRRMPVAPSEPLVAMKTGGSAKVGKVMREFKAGELHSGQDGKVVKNPKQAIAIALSEARRANRRANPWPSRAASG